MPLGLLFLAAVARATSLAPPPQRGTRTTQGLTPDDPRIPQWVASLLVDMPQDIPNTQRVDMLAVVRDLRRIHASLVTQRKVPGFHTSPDVPASPRAIASHVDPMALLQFFAQIAPQGEPIPVTLAVVTRPEGLAMVARVRLGDDLAQRLQRGSPEPGSWQLKKTDAGLIWTTGSHQLAASLHGPWLHLAPARWMLQPRTQDHGAGWPWLAPDLLAHVGDSDAWLLARPRAPMISQAPTPMDGSKPWALLQDGIRAFGVSWRHDAEASSAIEVLVDFPGLRRLDDFLQRERWHLPPAVWGGDAMNILVVAMPKGLVTLLQPWIAQRLRPFGEPWQALATHVGAWSGLAAFVGCGSPGDWGMSLEMTTATAAEAAFAAIAPTVGPGAGNATNDDHRDEASAPHPPAFATPLHVKILGRTLLLASNAPRLAQVTQRAQALRAPGDNPTPSPLAGPLTPMMRTIVEQPAWMVGYSVLGYDGSMIPWFLWLAQRTLQRHHAALPEHWAPFIDHLQRHLPEWISSLLTTFDAAFALTTDGSVVRLQLATSTI